MYYTHSDSQDIILDRADCFSLTCPCSSRIVGYPMMLLDHFPCILLERVQESVFAVVDMDSRDVFVGATPLKVLYKCQRLLT